MVQVVYSSGRVLAYICKVRILYLVLHEHKEPESVALEVPNAETSDLHWESSIAINDPYYYLKKKKHNKTEGNQGLER